jgi:transposase
MRYELTDYEWAAIRPMLPNKARGRVDESTCPQQHLLGAAIRRGAICRIAMARAPPARTVSSGGEGREYGAGSWTHLPPLMMRPSK